MRGHTLIELLVVLTIIGLVASVSVLTWRSDHASPTFAVVRELRAARADAVRSGRPIVWRQGELAVRFEPDGSNSGARIASDGAVVLVDALTGDVHVVR